MIVLPQSGGGIDERWGAEPLSDSAEAEVGRRRIAAARKPSLTSVSGHIANWMRVLVAVPFVAAGLGQREARTAHSLSESRWISGRVRTGCRTASLRCFGETVAARVTE